MASPALPVVVGVVLFVALGAIALGERADALAEDPVVAVGAGDPAVVRRPIAPPTRADAPGLVAAKKVRALSRRGEFLEALNVLRALAPEDRKAMGTSEYEGQERRLLQAAGERLLIRVKAQEPEQAIQKLEDFLAVPGVEGHPVEEKVRLALTKFAERAD